MAWPQSFLPLIKILSENGDKSRLGSNSRGNYLDYVFAENLLDGCEHSVRIRNLEFHSNGRGQLSPNVLF